MMPISLMNLYITEKCNLGCKYCFVKKIKAKTIESERALEAVDLLFKLSQNKKQLILTFFGGEPTIEWDLVKKLVFYGKNLARKNNKKINFNLVTNGTLITKSKVRFIKTHNIFVLLSADGIPFVQNLQRPFRDGKSSFDKAFRGLKLLQEKIPNRMAINMVVTPYSANKFYENINFFVRNKINKIAFNITYEDNWDKKALGKFEKEFNKVINLWLKRYSQNEILWLQPLHHFIKHLIDKEKYKIFYWAHPCKDERIAVSTRGKVFPCHRMLAFGKYKIGNVKSGLDVEKFGKYLKKKHKLFSKNPQTAGCPALNYSVNRNILKPVISFQDFYKIYTSGAEKIINRLTKC